MNVSSRVNKYTYIFWITIQIGIQIAIQIVIQIIFAPCKQDGQYFLIDILVVIENFQYDYFPWFE